MNKYLLFIALSAATLVSCNLEKEIDLDLPPFEPQLVVECYLEPGKPYRLNLFKTASYFAPASDLLNSLVADATVIITYQGVADTLRPGIYTDADNFYIYGSPTIVPHDFTNEFSLEIISKDGERLTATTTIAPPVRLDSVQVERTSFEDRVLVITFAPDNANQKNFYRRMLYRTTTERTDSLKIDFAVDDNIVSNGQLVLGGPPAFDLGDTMISQFMEIREEFYDYIDSRERLESANGNPFGQPGALKSNINGNGIGIFTGFTATLDTFYLN
jgi:hypothetical protein